MSDAVVILVVVHRPYLLWHEEISLRQCLRILGGHLVRLVCPDGLNLDAYRRIAPDIEADFVPAHWLKDYRGFNRLKIEPFLYRRYAKFDFVLFYELDAFVFRDDLLEWCTQRWDYVGAPWFEGDQDAAPDAAPAGAGNGGFSLRRTAAMLRVLRSWGHVIPADRVFAEWRRAGSLSPGSLWLLLRRLIWRNNFFAPLNDFAGNEDHFWAVYAARRFPWLRVAPYEAAKTFSFEVNAPRLYRENGNRLPFGCHKWMGLTPDFWFPIIRSFGYEVPESTGAAARS